VEITFTISACRLGSLLVAATTRGICFVSIGRTGAELEKRLRSEFPDIVPRRDDRAMASLSKAVNRRVEGKGLGEPLPLDLHGTPFQLSVWKEMLRIPPGSTLSYGDVARNIGRPTAFRAVAQACGANPVPVVVPCHRVVASGGSLGGYTGGIEKKIMLLANEGVGNPGWRRK